MSRSYLRMALKFTLCLGILLLNLIPGAHAGLIGGQVPIGEEEASGIAEAAAVKPLNTGMAAESTRRPIDAEEMEQFFDGVIPDMLAQYQIPGATVSVVRDGQLFFTKGYGLANVEQNIPVGAEQTLFRIGSTSKLFTWTAVMQLVEQGKIDLEADANIYLRDFQIPATYPQPVTIRHLMTHTAGFEEWGQGMTASSPEEMISLAEFLARYMPARVRAPGQVTAYSNYGTALAGYIVSQVSGMSFDEYIEENIFRPLGMSHSSFRQPLPADLAPDLAIGYSGSDGSVKAERFAYLNVAPAGAMASTAADMARFMIAHLQDGRYGEARILQSATARLMHQRQFANDPRLDGFAFGFFDTVQNQQHILKHGGSLPPYNTMLALLPERNIGVFVSYNGVMGTTAPDETLQSFLDHYYPVRQSQLPVPPADFAGRAARFAGTYRMTRSNYTKVERVVSLGGMGMGAISASPDGTLVLALVAPRAPSTSKFVEISPLVFQEVNGPEKLVFREDEHGRITYLFVNSFPHSALERVAWYEAPRFNQLLLLTGLAAILSVLLAFVIGLVRRRQRPDQMRVAALITSLLIILLPASVGLTGTGIVKVSTAVLKIAQTLTFILPGLAGLLIVLAVLAWARRKWSLIGRIHFSLVALSSVGFVWLLNAFNLLGYH